MGFFKKLFSAKNEKKIFINTEGLEKIGLKDVLIWPDKHLEVEARPILLVSYKQFDRITKLFSEVK